MGLSDSDKRGRDCEAVGQTKVISLAGEGLLVRVGGLNLQAEPGEG